MLWWGLSHFQASTEANFDKHATAVDVENNWINKFSLSLPPPCLLLSLSSSSDGSAVGPSNLGNVISQLLLCKQINPDFHSEELCSITKDSQEIAKLLSEMQEYMPKQEAYLGKLRASPRLMKY